MGSLAIVTDIQGYSIHDGPGIRTVVFVKGCPLRCKWCANPENLTCQIQVGFLKGLCKTCGKCMEACKHGAIVPSPDGFRIDRTKCIVCGECISHCYYDAREQYGEEMTPEQAFREVIKDKMFYDGSGGGVTVSGGEPLLYADFVHDLFELVKAEGVNTCIETCGAVGEQAFRKVMDVTDRFLFDLKLMDPIQHKEWTGLSNEQILGNARMLAQEGATILFRQPLIPGANNDDANIEATAEFIRSLGRDDIALQLMPFHRMGNTKYGALDMDYAVADVELMSNEAVDAVCEKYKSLGIDCSVSR